MIIFILFLISCKGKRCEERVGVELMSLRRTTLSQRSTGVKAAFKEKLKKLEYGVQVEPRLKQVRGYT